ncbi:hypothetical protein VNI00_015322, partial [Paramarasmius palmivorus]
LVTYIVIHIRGMSHHSALTHSNPSYPQLVLLDHGLYVRLSDDFRKEWSTLWARGLLRGDYTAVEKITKKWGVGLPDMFASVTLSKPVKLSRKDRDMKEEQERLRRELTEYMGMSQYEQSVVMKKKLKAFLQDTDKMPKELVFLMRNMRCVYHVLFLEGENRKLISTVCAGSYKATTNPSAHP